MGLKLTGSKCMKIKNRLACVSMFHVRLSQQELIHKNLINSFFYPVLSKKRKFSPLAELLFSDVSLVLFGLECNHLQKLKETFFMPLFEKNGPYYGKGHRWTGDIYCIYSAISRVLNPEKMALKSLLDVCASQVKQMKKIIKRTCPYDIHIFYTTRR